MFEVIGIGNALLAFLALSYSIKHAVTRAVFFPLLISLVFYTLWPVSEQLFLGIAPVNGLDLSDTGLKELVLSTTGALAALLVMCRIVSRRQHREALAGAPSVPAAAVMLLIGATGLLFSTEFQPLRLTSYEENIVASHLSVWIPVSKSLISYACALMLYAELCRASRAPFRLFLRLRIAGWSAIPVLLAFGTSDKDPVLPIIAAVALFAAPRLAHFGPLRLGAVVFSGCLGSLLFLLYFSAYRGGADLPELMRRLVESEFELFSITAADPGGPYISLTHEYNQGIPEHLAPDFEQRLRSVIPSSLFGGGLLGGRRPDTIETVYAKFMLARFDVGSGLGFHPLAESHLDFGPFFAWTYIVILAGLALVPMVLVLRFSRDAGLHLLASLVVFSAMVISHRMALEGTMKAIVAHGTIQLTTYFIARRIAVLLQHLFSPGASSVGLRSNPGEVEVYVAHDGVRRPAQ